MFEDISIGEDDVPPPIVEEDGQGAVVVANTSSTHRSLHRSAHSSGMESSVLRFKNVNFIVGKKGEEKNILTDVSGTVRWGRKCSRMRGFDCSGYVDSSASQTFLDALFRVYTDVLACMGPSGAGLVKFHVF